MKKIIVLLFLMAIFFPTLGAGQDRINLSKAQWDQLSEKEKKALLSKIKKLTSAKAVIEVNKIYIPYKDWQNFLLKNQKLILLKYDRFLALVQKAQKSVNETVNETTTSPNASPLQKLHLQGEEKDGKIKWLAEYSIFASQRGPISISILGDPGRALTMVSKALLNGQTAPLQAWGGQFLLHLPQKGKHLLKIFFTSSLSTWKNQRRTSISLSSCPVASLSLKMKGHLQLSLPGTMIQARYTSSPLQTKFSGAIAKVNRLNFIFTEKIPKKKFPHLLSTTTQTLLLGGGLAKIQATIQYRPYLAKVKKIEIQIPQGFSLTSEPDLGKLEKYWQVKKNRLLIYLPKGQKKSFLCKVSFLAPLSKKLGLSPWSTGAFVENGSLVVALEQGLAISHSTSVGLVQKPLSPVKLPQSYSGWASFDYFQAPYSLSLSLADIPTAIQAHARILVGWKANQIHTQLGVIYAVQQGRLSQCRIQLPSRGEPGKVTMNPPGRYQWEEATRELVFFPKEPVKKGSRFYVQLDFLQESGETLTLPFFQIKNVDQVTGYLALSAPAIYQVQLQNLKNLILVDPREVAHYGLKDSKIRFAYRFRTSYSGEAQRRKIQAHISAQIHSLLTLKSQYNQISSQVIFNIKSAPTRSVSFQIPPEGAESLEVWAGKSQIKYPKPYLVQIVFPRPRKGKVAISLRYRTPRPVEFSPLLPRGIGVLRQSGSLLIAIEDNLKVNITADPSVRQVDSRTLPSLQAGVKPFFACTYLGQRPKLQLKAMDLQQTSAPQCIISSLQQWVQLDQKGSALCKAVMTFYSLNAKEIGFTLPSNSELWSVTLDGKGVKPIEKGESFAISLSGLTNSRATMAITYLRRHQGSGWMLEVDSPLPTPQGPVLASEQTIFLPEGYPLVKFGGNMRGGDVTKKLLLLRVGYWLAKRLKPFLIFFGALLALALFLYLLAMFYRAMNWTVSWGNLATGTVVVGATVFIAWFVLTPRYRGSRSPAKYQKGLSGGAERRDLAKKSSALPPQSPGMFKSKSRRKYPAYKNEEKFDRPSIREGKKRYFARKDRFHRGKILAKRKSLPRDEEKEMNKPIAKAPLEDGLAAGKGKSNKAKEGERQQGGGPKGPGRSSSSYRKGSRPSDKQVKLAYLFSTKKKIRGLNSLALALKMEGRPYQFQRSSGLGTVKVRALSASALYPFLALLALVTFLVGWWIGRAGGSARIFYLAGVFGGSYSMALLGGPLFVPFANGLSMGALALVMVFLLPGICSFLSHRLSSSGTAVVLALLLLAPQGLQAQTKQGPRQGPKVSKYKVYIPYNSKKGLPQKKDRVFLSLKDYYKLLKSAQNMPPKAISAIPLLAKALYQGEIKSSRIDFKATLTFRLPLKKRVLFPVYLAKAQILQATSGAEDVPVLVRNNQFYLLLPLKKKAEVKIHFTLYPKGDRYSFQIPPAGAGEMVLKNHSKGFVYAETLGKSSEKKGETLVIPLGGRTGIQLYKRRKGSKRYLASLKATQISKVYLYPGFFVFRSQWKLENLKKKLQLEIPPSCKITSLIGRKTGQRWWTPLEWQRAKNVITLFLPQRALRNYEVQVTAVARYGGSSFVLPVIRSLARLRKLPALGIFAPPFLRVSLQGDLGRCDPALFQWKARYAYTIKGTKQPTINLSWKKSKVSHQTRILAYMEKDRMDVDGYFTVKSPGAPLYQLVIQIQKGWKLRQDLSVPGLLDQVPLGKNKFLLIFSKPISSKGKTLLLPLRGYPQGGKISLPQISLFPSKPGETLVGIYKRKELKVQALNIKGLNIYSGRIFPPQGKIPRGFEPALALRTRSATYQTLFQIGLHQPKIKFQSAVVAKVSPQEVQYRGEGVFEIFQAPTEKLTFWIPQEVQKTFLLQGNFHWGTPKNGWIPVIVRLGKRALGKIALNFSYSLALAKHRKFALSFPRFPYQGNLFCGASLEGDEFSILKKEGFDVLLRFPAPFQGPGLKSQLYFERKDDKGELWIERKKITATTSLPALVRSAHLIVQMDGTGETLVQGRYRVQNHSDQFMKIQLPDQAKLWSVYVEANQVSTSPAGKNAYLIPLPKKPKGDLFFWVEVVYRNPQPAKGSFSSRSLPLARVIHPPVDQTFVTLRVPQGYHFSFSEDSNLHKSSSARVGLSIASQMSEEMLDLSSLSEKTGYKNKKQIILQQRYLGNQKKLLSHMLSNIRKAESGYDKKSSQEKAQVRELRQKYNFYQNSLNSSIRKLQRALRQKWIRHPQGGYRYQNRHLPLDLLSLDPYERALSRNISLALPWKKTQIRSGNLVSPLPHRQSNQIARKGPSYFPQSNSNFQVHHFYKTGGNPSLVLYVYPLQTTRTGKIFLALLASLLLLISAHLRNFLHFQGEDDWGKLAHLGIIFLLFALMVTFFRWYWMGALVALLAGLDILFWLKRRKKQAKTV